MSIVLVLCTRMWRSTAYVLDIAVQKQVYLQKKWAVRGILNCGIRACRTDFPALLAYVKERGAITIPITSYTFDIPHLAQYNFQLIFKEMSTTSLRITAQLLHDKKTILEESVEFSAAYIVA